MEVTGTREVPAGLSGEALDAGGAGLALLGAVERVLPVKGVTVGATKGRSGGGVAIITGTGGAVVAVGSATAAPFCDPGVALETTPVSGVPVPGVPVPGVPVPGVPVEALGVSAAAPEGEDEAAEDGVAVEAEAPLTIPSGDAGTAPAVGMASTWFEGDCEGVGAAAL